MGYSKKEILESRKRSLEALKHRIQSESKADNIPLYEVEKKYAPLIKFYKEEIEKMETNDNDATENEDLTKMEGKNKEIEKMPLEKDPVQAQDSKFKVLYYTGKDLPSSKLKEEFLSAENSEKVKEILRKKDPNIWRWVEIRQVHDSIDNQKETKDGYSFGDPKDVILAQDSYEILQLSGFTIDATPYQIGDIVWVRIKGEEYKGKILRLDNNRAYIYCMPLDTTGWINISQLRGKA